MVLYTYILMTAFLSQIACVSGECTSNSRYRSADGSCNNVLHPSWGRAGTIQRRLLDRNGLPMVEYGDGYNTPRGFPDRLPDARLVSSVIATSRGHSPVDTKRTGQHMSFGQLLAHDFIETKLPQGINCCNVSDIIYDNIDFCFPFQVPQGDRIFAHGCKNFARATKASSPKYGNIPVHREQINLLSSYIDCSFLYGDSEYYTDKLREDNSCMLKTDAGNLLPTFDAGPCFKIDPSHDKCPLSGDRRVHEAPNLGLNVLVFVREHNRVCMELTHMNSHWHHNKTFQETRRLIIAMVQHITYNHFIPLVIGSEHMRMFGLKSRPKGYNNIYNSDIDPSIFNGFGAAAWRYGHSQIMDEVSELTPNFRTINVHKIEDNLFSPNLYQYNYGDRVEDLSRWLAVNPASRIDRFQVGGIQNKLFYLSSPPGSDLFALNVQRGRDQGIPRYNRWRQLCGLNPFTSFKEFGDVGSKLASIYKNIEDVDLYVGAILETGNDGTVGPTFACLIGIQFKLLKIGDRFWYESSDPTLAFTEDQLDSIKANTSLSKIWCRNFGLDYIQQDIFEVPSLNNLVTFCDSLPDVDLSLWKD